MKHLSSYGVKKDEVLKVYQQLRKNREAELTKNKIKEIKEQLKSDDLDEETRAELEKELKDGVDEKLADTDKINAAYLRRAIKKVKPTITDEASTAPVWPVRRPTTGSCATWVRCSTCPSATMWQSLTATTPLMFTSAIRPRM